jgi:hypothetical protein
MEEALMSNVIDEDLKEEEKETKSKSLFEWKKTIFWTLIFAAVIYLSIKYLLP